MNDRIPIVLTFDNNLTRQACVFLNSLVRNSLDKTKYLIYVLYIDLSKESMWEIRKCCADLELEIHFFASNEFIGKGFEIRGITSTAYCRLAIPFILKDLERIIYCDVDMIVNSDLSELYNLNLNGKCIGGVKTSVTFNKLNNFDDTYINSGMLVWNIKGTPIELVNESIKLSSHSKYKYQDQDIINIVYKDYIFSEIPVFYNFVPKAIETSIIGKKSLEEEFSCNIPGENLEPRIIHYAGPKPWIFPVLMSDIWWEYARNSCVYSFKEYLEFIGKKPSVVDILKQIKRKIITW